jgi:HAD superfamily hydrolase (TIGR01509 family)
VSPSALLVDVGNVLFFEAPVDQTFVYEAQRALSRDGQDRPLPGLFPVLRSETWRDYEPGVRAIFERAVGQAWAVVQSRWEQLCVPIPGALEALAALQFQRKAVLANQPRETGPVLRRFGVDRIVDFIFLDSEVGLSKPDRRFFEHALAQLGVTASEAMMVGDRADNDIVPARALGIKTTWVQPPGRYDAAVPGIPNGWSSEYVELAAAEVSHRTAPEAELRVGSLRDLPAALGLLLGKAERR